MMPAGDWELLLRDPSGLIIDPLPWAKLGISPRHNDVGSLTATFSGAADLRAQLARGNGLVVRYLGRPVISGTLETDAAWTVSKEDPDPGTLTVAVRDDLSYLADEIIWPNPAAAWTAQNVNSYRTVSGTPETIVRTLVGESITPSAPITARRRILTLEPTNHGLGTATSRQARFDNLLEVCRDVLLPNALGMQALQTDTGPQLRIFAPTNRSAEVVFSEQRHNLVGWDYQPSRATGTWFGVGGQGVGNLRNLRESTVAGSARRIAVFIDRRDTNDNAELDQALAEAVAGGGESVSLALTVRDQDGSRFGVDYFIGDLVGAEIGSLTFTQTVQGVDITVDDSGVQVTPILGTSDAMKLRTFEAIRNLSVRTGRLEHT